VNDQALCRREQLFAPWQCKAEEHKYELCQYAGYKRRLLKQSYLKHKENHVEAA
jgi:NADH-ubiquinone oxidoreductase B18 subunit (NDUFB7)